MESVQKQVSITVDNITLQGNLTIPSLVTSIVIFAHGSGSSRFSPRNTYVAQQLNQHHIATLLIDLLTSEEDRIYSTRFNIDLLSQRLLVVTQWIGRQTETRNLPIGLFGASTGAASALAVAASLNDTIQAVVSRGGRPDLVISQLPEVSAPTLFIVGEFDVEVMLLNREAFENLSCVKSFEVVRGATHLFEEAGALEQVSTLAANWFIRHLVRKNIGNKIPEVNL